MSTYSDELIKEAIIRKLYGMTLGSAGKGVRAIGETLTHPVSMVRKGWKGMSPGGGAIAAAKDVKMPLSKYLKNTVGEKTIIPGLHKIPKKYSHLYRRKLTGGIGLAKNKGLAASFRHSKVKGVAEELSRRGWTGEGRATKYLPIGDKSIFTGFNAPLVAAAARGKLTGSDVGGSAGWLAASASPVGFAGWMAADSAGRYIGRKADKGIAKAKKTVKRLRSSKRARSNLQRELQHPVKPLQQTYVNATPMQRRSINQLV